MRHSLLILLLSLTYSVHALSVPTGKQCKSIAGLTGWPDPPVWKKFNTTLSGALLEPLPPAQACYTSVSNSSSTNTLCDYTTSSWKLSSFHSADPVSVAYPNWQDDACVPPLLSEGSGRCSLNAFPKYVVNASTAEHVAQTVKFAASNSVRIVVKGGAHDLLGRSTAPSVLSLWTRHLQGFQYHERFSACPSDSTRYTAITAAAGHVTGEIQQMAADHNMTIVGAADPSVGLGGFLTGGGHSPLGSLHGMAVDNVLQLSLVTPNGDIITASPCRNPDIFWAVRGGGGATFGVLVNATLRAYPVPTIALARFEFNSSHDEATSNSNNAFYAAAASVIADMPALYSEGLAGYFSLMPISTSNDGLPQMNFAFLIYLLNGSLGQLQGALDPIMSRLNATPEFTTSITTQYVPNYLGFQSSFFVADKVGNNRLTVSRLWGEQAVANKSGVEQTLRKFSSQMLQGTCVSGEGVQKKSSDDSALNPAWRRTVVEMMSGIPYPLGANASKRGNTMTQADMLSTALSEQAPDMGTYSNEAWIHQADFRKAFWGEHYARLLAIKRRIDPKGVFWCQWCVGAEDWVLGDGGALCKA
ncbi:GlcD FAD/FMN-containing dehydrogenase [Pyrenophora teres f. maculata]|nr:GlcD FAD/FMN-containing dehydrogenase [Pyrenophora teres f. maculata]